MIIYEDDDIKVLLTGNYYLMYKEVNFTGRWKTYNKNHLYFEIKDVHNKNTKIWVSENSLGVINKPKYIVNKC